MNIEAIITPYNRESKTGRDIKYLVFHYTGTMAAAKNNALYYASAKIGASAHYYLDAGQITYQGVEDKDVAWHCGATKYVHPECRNANSIGIEMVPRKVTTTTMLATDTDWYFAPETVENAVALGRTLMRRYAIPVERVLRHYDVTGKLCPNPFCVDEKARAAWEAFRARLAADDDAPQYNVNEGKEIDMTRDEVLALVREELAAHEKAYQTVDALPEWGRPTVQRLLGAGVLFGDEKGCLNLSEDLLRALVIQERAKEVRA